MSFAQPQVNELTISNLSAQRAGNVVFEKISFSLKSGEMLAVSGENGSGKSTLLLTLAQILPPLSGKISLISPHNNPIRYIGHKDALKMPLTVRENLSFWSKLYNGKNIFLEKSIDDFQINNVLDIPANNLSAGFKKRVTLTRLVFGFAPLWILDEPYTNMDKKNIRALDELLDKHLERAGMVIIASHQLINSKAHYHLNLDLKPHIPKEL